MKISKKTREEAAMICAIAASNIDLANAYRTIKRLTGAHYGSFQLALAAWSTCSDVLYDSGNMDPFSTSDAEAAQLLADGWSPGDEP